MDETVIKSFSRSLEQVLFHVMFCPTLSLLIIFSIENFPSRREGGSIDVGKTKDGPRAWNPSITSNDSGTV